MAVCECLFCLWFTNAWEALLKSVKSPEAYLCWAQTVMSAPSQCHVGWGFLSYNVSGLLRQVSLLIVFSVSHNHIIGIIPKRQIVMFNSSPLDKMAASFADDIFKCIFLNENDRIPIQISLKLVPRSAIDNEPVLVKVLAWRRTGDKPLTGPIMI